MKLEKYSFGIGDRFALQGKAQLRAIIKAKEQGLDIIPVWNKSHREHITIKSSPADVRIEADHAVKALGWNGSYHVDADHINLGNVDLFIDSSDFFTLDVADFIGKVAEEEDIKAFVSKYEISRRESEIVELICKGQSNQDISDSLFISLQTVKDHVYRIYLKTGAKNRVQLTNLIRTFPE